MSHVIATAGHVDHGKSALVRALTGMEPDRWEEEHRRGLTLDLGFVWTRLPDGRALAFVDVPGHQRFTANMLAGVGPVPAALFVVAADEGWARQSDEHLAALAALEVRDPVLAVTKADLADVAPVLEDASRRLAAAGLSPLAAVGVSARTGTGLDELRTALERLLDALPAPDPAADVRLWVDRAFSIRGSGTVVTGTLAAGRLAVGDELELHPGERRVQVRGLQTMEEPVPAVGPVARVALNLRGVRHDELRRGQALCTPGAYALRHHVDVRLVRTPDPRAGDVTDPLVGMLMLHVGSAAVPVRARPLGARSLRLSLDGLPLRIGDRGVLRDPAAQRVVAGIVVLDPDPPPLRGRGVAASRAAVLEELRGRVDAPGEVARRGPVPRAALRALGALPPGGPLPEGLVELADHVVEAQAVEGWRRALHEAVVEYARTTPLARGLEREEARRLLGVPAPVLRALVASDPRLVDESGGLRPVSPAVTLPPQAEAALGRLRGALAGGPFRAPPAVEQPGLGLTPPVLALLVRTGAILRLPGDVVLLAEAEEAAVGRLRGLGAPFTLSEARQALDTTRRTAVPLMEHLDARGRTRRLDDTHRVVADR